MPKDNKNVTIKSNQSSAKNDKNSIYILDFTKIFHALKEDKYFIILLLNVFFISLIYYQIFILLPHQLEYYFSNNLKVHNIFYSVVSFLFNIGKNNSKLSNFIFGYLFLENTVIIIISQIFFNKLQQKINNKLSFIIGLSSIGVAYILYSLSTTNINMYLVGMLFLSIGEIFSLPRIPIITNLLSRDENKGMYFGIVKSVRSIGVSLGPFLCGIIMSLTNTSFTWILFFIFILFAIFFNIKFGVFKVAIVE